jgi:hypothetical protein
VRLSIYLHLSIPFFCAALSFLPGLAQAQGAGQQQDAQAQGYNAQRQTSYAQAELDALLAPIALYPDDVVRLVLDASTAPAEVAEAAQWSRVNRGMTGEDAVRAVQAYGWQPSVKALVAYPDLLERMAESPQWSFDLGNAWLGQQAEVMNTVQVLRQRAYDSGGLRSDNYQTVQATDQGIAVAPAMPYIYYVPYYDPLVVYGGWWWPAYRPVHWRPWHPSPVFVTNVVVVNRGFRGPAFAHHGNISPAARFQARNNAAFVARAQAAGRPAQFQNQVPAQSFHSQSFRTEPFRRVPESQRQPSVQSRGQPFVQSHGQPFVQSRVAPAFPQHQGQRPAFAGQHSAPRSSAGGSTASQHPRGRS